MKIYRVGGAVRDKLLHYPSHENDWVVIGSTPDEMSKLGYRPVGQDFPVFIKPETGEEYALARTERKTGLGYGGFSFHTAPDISLEDDLVRRDLTINAMAAADSVLVPMQCEYFALEGLTALMDTISKLAAVVNENLKIEYDQNLDLHHNKVRAPTKTSVLQR